MDQHLVLRGGLVVDGTGAAPAVADLRVQGDRIVEIGPAIAAGPAELDVGGLVVCPGFIEAHRHGGLQVRDPRAVRARLSLGVTTTVVGACGRSVSPAWAAARLGHRRRPGSGWPTFAAFFREVDEAPPGLNVAALVGHATLRLEAMGNARRAAWPSERRLLATWLDEAMAAGCLGLSTSPTTEPGRHAPEEEVAGLVGQAAEAGGVWVTSAAAGLDPTWAIARSVDVRTVVTHVRAGGHSAGEAPPNLVVNHVLDGSHRAAALSEGADQVTMVTLTPGSNGHDPLAQLLATAPLPEAVHRATALPATTLGLADRGVLRPGAWADVVVLDPAAVPAGVGIRHVLVNGSWVWRDGRPTEARVGRALRR